MPRDQDCAGVLDRYRHRLVVSVPGRGRRCLLAAEEGKRIQRDLQAVRRGNKGGVVVQGYSVLAEAVAEMAHRMGLSVECVEDTVRCRRRR